MKATIFGNASRGAFLFLIIPIFLLLSLYGCDSTDTGIIDPSIDSPFIVSFKIFPEEIDTDSIFVSGGGQAGDSITVTWNYEAEIEPRGVSDMNVHYSIVNPQFARPIGEGIIEEIINIQTDIISLTGEITASVPRTVVGLQTISLYAKTTDGFTSNQFKKNVRLVRLNEPPEIINVEAPDTVDTATINNETTIIFRVFVDDPNGVDDVIRVSAYNVQPDNELRVIPDLTREVPGIFRIDIPFPSNAKLGTHRFHFRAYDRMNESSEEYIHEMVVK